jgi:hypothetical protein
MDAKLDIPEHPLLKKLAGSTDVTTLRGYVGAGKNDASIRIYTSLDDLSESVEVNKADVLHYASTPETVQPFGSTTIWIKREAQTTYKLDRVDKTATVKEIRAGRLQIVVPGGGLRQNVCQSVCGVCQSVCGVCQSVCSAQFGRADLANRLRNRSK